LLEHLSKRHSWENKLAKTLIDPKIHITILLNKHARLLSRKLLLHQDLQHLRVCYHTVLDDFHSATDFRSRAVKVTNAPDIKMRS
jgi:hypothetical protein